MLRLNFITKLENDAVFDAFQDELFTKVYSFEIDFDTQSYIIRHLIDGKKCLKSFSLDNVVNITGKYYD